jgi:hypothetical protein
VSLYTVSNGNTINAADINQLVTALGHGVRNVTTAAQSADNTSLTATSATAYPNLSIPSVTTQAGTSVIVYLAGSLICTTGAGSSSNIAFTLTGLGATGTATYMGGTGSAYGVLSSLAQLLFIPSSSLGAGSGGTFSPVLNYLVTAGTMACRASSQAYYENLRIAIIEYVFPI